MDRVARKSGTERAFTLVEVLVAVAIISVLASIALFNFRGAQSRATMAAALEELRSLANGIEMYSMDYNSYPFAFPISGYDEDRYIRGAKRDKKMDWDDNHSFKGSFGIEYFRLFAPNTYYVLSVGPNGIFDNGAFFSIYGLSDEEKSQLRQWMDDGRLDRMNERLLRIHDPSNGTGSAGDLVVHGP